MYYCFVRQHTRRDHSVAIITSSCLSAGWHASLALQDRVGRRGLTYRISRTWPFVDSWLLLTYWQTLTLRRRYGTFGSVSYLLTCVTSSSSSSSVSASTSSFNLFVYMGNVHVHVHVLVHVFVHVQVNFGADHVQNGRTAAIFDFRYNILHIIYFHQHSLGGASVLHTVIMHHMQYGGGI